ncbi:hypothetical protein HET69_14240 [Streptomyces sp. CJ_13]|uniref:hypothetical protein n=1 Tax=Streptomyces sp. CJ_13 TaxID=2724943 RepID=UPI001BDBC635|nr:hypothetical protein [Streptomyces sp. CJ_13]MBT1185140.1 hypothetical protein [Streptomyces sp. CJ_13]
MSQRQERVQYLLEQHAARCKEVEQSEARLRELFVKQAREQAERGQSERALKSAQFALTSVRRANLDAYGAKLLSWLEDDLVWVRPTNARYSKTYHYSKTCSYVFYNYATEFTPLLEGEAKDRGMRVCSRDACRRETSRRKWRAYAAAA